MSKIKVESTEELLGGNQIPFRRLDCDFELPFLWIRRTGIVFQCLEFAQGLIIRLTKGRAKINNFPCDVFL